MPTGPTLEEMQRAPFGRLSVLGEGARDARRRKHWLCQCVCGKQCLADTGSLVSGNKQSCGCLIKEAAVRTGTRRWRGHGEISGSYFTKIRHHARDRGREFSITLEYIWDVFLRQERRCALTGLGLRFGRFRERGVQTASLDRIDSSGGYAAGNVQWIHKDLQPMKSNLDEAEFIRLCKLVAAHRR